MSNNKCSVTTTYVVWYIGGFYTNEDLKHRFILQWSTPLVIYIIIMFYCHDITPLNIEKKPQQSTKIIQKRALYHLQQSTKLIQKRALYHLQQSTMTRTTEMNNMVEERYQLCISLYLIKKETDKRNKEKRNQGADWKNLTYMSIFAKPCHIKILFGPFM